MFHFFGGLDNIPQPYTVDIVVEGTSDIGIEQMRKIVFAVSEHGGEML